MCCSKRGCFTYAYQFNDQAKHRVYCVKQMQSDDDNNEKALPGLFGLS